jgi:hypothetical protein
MKIPLRWIPQEIITQYNLLEYAEDDGYVYVEIRKGMYGLIQAARIAYNRLINSSNPMTIIQSAIHQAYGDTKPSQPSLHFVSMTLESNTSTSSMPIT